MIRPIGDSCHLLLEVDLGRARGAIASLATSIYARAGMKAIVHREYGSPDALCLEEVERPIPGDDEVLVKVHASCINEWDWGRLRGTPFANRTMFGLLRPRRGKRILGCDIAGTVEAVGGKVTRLRPGDEVFGDLSGCGWGGLAEYVCGREDALAPKPAAMSFEQAAAVPQAGLLALQALRKGEVERRRRVLFNGGGGGVGTFGIQIARHLGAEVTGVDSAAKLELMRSVGADHVVDHAREDFTRNGQTYDLVIDVVAQRSLSDYRRSLSPGGMCVIVGGSTGAILTTVAFGWRGDRTVELLVYRPSSADLLRMNEFFEAGAYVPVIDRRYCLEEVPEAFRYYGSGAVRGKVVITVGALPEHQQPGVHAL